MKFHDGLIILHEQMLDDELSPVGQNLGELREGARQEIGFRPIVTGERMCAFDDPVDLIVDMLEKARAVALLKTLKILRTSSSVIISASCIYASNLETKRPVSVFPPFSRSSPGNFALSLLADVSTL
jgi:hypothetical protein